MFLDKSMVDLPWTSPTRLSEPSPATASRFFNLAADQPSQLLFSTPNLNSFHLFPNLPPEIRQHIFRLSLPSRVLTITYDSQKNIFTTCTSPPSLFCVSREARLAALQLYKLSFGTASTPPRIHFSPCLDTLYLPRCGEMGYDENFRTFKSIVMDASQSLNSLKSVAIDHVDPNIKRPWESYNKASFLRGFENLDEILLVHDNKVERRTTQGSDKVLRFTTPTINPEQQLQMWWHFRQAFAVEENILAEVCGEMGMDYEVFTLPTIRICEKEVLW